MRFAMADPAFQAALFRFVDAFPGLRSAEEVSRHLEEYFDYPGAPGLVRAAVRVARRAPGGSAVAAGLARREIARMARQFVVGTEPAEVVRRLGERWRAGVGAVVDLLGEHTHSDAEADRYAQRLASLVEALVEVAPSWPANERLERDDRGPLPRAAIAVKPTALAPDYAPLTAASGVAGAARRLRPILRLAAERGVQVWFDMERYEVKELTHALVGELLADEELAGLHAGVVVQAYLRDSPEDLDRLVELARRRATPLGVRLVKGAYWDTETIVARAAGWPVPVFESKAQTDANFERLVRVLHAHHRVVRAAVGTHNLRSLAYALRAAAAAGVPPEGVEVQLLYGMAEPVHEAVRRLGLRLRVYAPMGELVPGMAYLVRRLLENTSNESFVRRRFAEGAALDALLRPPVLDGPLPGPPPPVVVRRPSDPASPGPYAPEPLAQWFRAETRERMAAALEACAARLGRELPAVIGGREVRTGREIVSVDPADPGTVVARVACCGVAEADAAVERALEAVESWRRRPAAERAAVCLRVAARLRERRFELAALEVFETGKTWAHADADVCEAIDYAEYYAREALRLSRGGAVQSPPGEVNRLLYEARGVAAVISPWNFPLAIPAGMTLAALVTGNAVVLKPAEQAPAVAAALVETLLEAGVPEGVCSYLPGYGEEVGAHLVGHPGVAIVAFTGSKAVGLAINEAAARTSAGQRELRRVVVEMGGKNALVVDADADLDVAVPAAVESAFGYAGQRCSAASRFVVLDAVHDAFLERVVEAARALVLGHPREMGTQVGPVIDEDALARLSSWQERAADYGRVVLRREDLPAKGYFVGPTIVDDVDPSSPLATEELFGPVVAVLRARDFARAVELVNGVDYALTAGVISRSPRHIAEASAELRAGNVYVNRTIVGAVVGRQPFGGHGLSGLGTKAGGPDYLLWFTNPRVVSENTMRQGFAPAATASGGGLGEPGSSGVPGEGSAVRRGVRRRARADEGRRGRR